MIYLLNATKQGLNDMNVITTTTSKQDEQIDGIIIEQLGSEFVITKTWMGTYRAEYYIATVSYPIASHIGTTAKLAIAGLLAKI